MLSANHHTGQAKCETSTKILLFVCILQEARFIQSSQCTSVPTRNIFSFYKWANREPRHGLLQRVFFPLDPAAAPCIPWVPACGCHLLVQSPMGNRSDLPPHIFLDQIKVWMLLLSTPSLHARRGTNAFVAVLQCSIFSPHTK